MKIIGISGSPREKNTSYMLKVVLDATGQDYELIQLKDLEIKPCSACKGCHETFKCIIEDDMQNLYRQMLDADYIVLGSPTYFDNVSGIMKNFMDRCLPFYLSNELRNKKVALVTVGNYKGGEKLRSNQNIDQTAEINSVEKCLRALECFCTHLGLKLIGSVYAIRSNPQEKEEELIKLGKKLIS